MNQTLEIKTLQKEIKVDRMTLESGNDILANELNLVFHQPLLSEIAILGEENFLDALSLINFNKECLRGSGNIEDELLDNSSDFLWIMLLLKNNKKKMGNLTILLQTLLKNYEILILPDNMMLLFENKSNKKNNIKITELNYDIFKQYINIIFNTNKKDKSSYNTDSAYGDRIAKKLEEGRKKVQDIKNKNKNNTSVLCNNISSLAEAMQKTLIEVYQGYTMYQFYIQLLRYQKHTEYEQCIKAVMFGAKDIKIENWFEDL